MARTRALSSEDRGMMADVPKLIVVPRMGGTGHSDFYPRLIARAASEFSLTAQAVELLPIKEAPEPAPTARAVTAALQGADQAIVLAHSVGCLAALMAAAALPDGRSLAALICVAGWFTVEQPWPTIMPWLAEDLFDETRVRARVRHLAAVISDNDPFTPDYGATRTRFERMGATVTVVSGRRHFNTADEPAAWQALEAAIAAI